MNTNPYSNSFGRSPDAFRQCVARALRDTREPGSAIKRGSLRLALAIGLITVLLVGAAYAAARHFGLLAMYSEIQIDTLTDQGREILAQEGTPLAEETFGDVTVTVREALYDGRCLYMTVVLTHADPHTLLLGVDEEEQDAPRPAGAQRYLRTNLSASPPGERYNQWCDYRRDEAGNLIYVLGSAIPREGDTLPLECLIITSEETADGQAIEGTRIRNSFALEVPTLPIIETLTQPVAQTLDKLSVAVESVTMTRTPLALYYTVAYALPPAATPEQREAVRDGLWARLLDAQGAPLPDGMSLSGSIDSEDDVRFIISGSLALDAIPDILTLEFYNGHTKEIFGRIAVSLKPNAE